MSKAFWVMVLTMFRPGAPGETISIMSEGIHYTSEAECLQSVLKEQPAGAVQTTDGRWSVWSCVKVEPQR
jgi:hypothetical protein